MEEYVEFVVFKVEIEGHPRSDFFLSDVFPASGALGHTGSDGVDEEPFYDIDAFYFRLDDTSGRVFVIEDFPIVIGALYNGEDASPDIKAGLVVQITVNADEDSFDLPRFVPEFDLATETQRLGATEAFDGVYFVTEATHVIQQQAGGAEQEQEPAETAAASDGDSVNTQRVVPDVAIPEGPALSANLFGDFYLGRDLVPYEPRLPEGFGDDERQQDSQPPQPGFADIGEIDANDYRVSNDVLTVYHDETVKLRTEMPVLPGDAASGTEDTRYSIEEILARVTELLAQQGAGNQAEPEDGQVSLAPLLRDLPTEDLVAPADPPIAEDGFVFVPDLQDEVLLGF